MSEDKQELIVACGAYNYNNESSQVYIKINKSEIAMHPKDAKHFALSIISFAEAIIEIQDTKKTKADDSKS